MKLAVIYDTKTGTTKQAAEWIAEGMQKVSGVIGCPTYAALMTPGMRTWLLESAGKLEMAGKLGGAFATEQYTHGGANLVIQSILTNELVFGMLCYSGGAACGRPVIHIGPVGVNDNMEKFNGMENYKDYFNIYGERFATKAAELFGE